MWVQKGEEHQSVGAGVGWLWTRPKSLVNYLSTRDPKLHYSLLLTICGSGRWSREEGEGGKEPAGAWGRQWGQQQQDSVRMQKRRGMETDSQILMTLNSRGSPISPQTDCYVQLSPESRSAMSGEVPS